MPHIQVEPAYRYDDPLAQDEYENILKSNQRSPLMQWWMREMAPQIEQLDALLNNKPYVKPRDVNRVC